MCNLQFADAGTVDSSPKARPPGFETGTFWAHEVQLSPMLYPLGYGHTPL